MAAPVVVCVQFDAEHGNVPANATKVRQLLRARLDRSDAKQPIDLLILPELALTGYVFEDHTKIEPLLEAADDGSNPVHGNSPGTGPTVSLARELAREYRCHVLAGFPERASHRACSVQTAQSIAHDARPPGSETHVAANGLHHAYNSAILVDPAGNPLRTFRKHFLYDDDKRWASEGPGFETVELPGLGKVCVAICMDLNPYNFTAPFESYELANFCLRESVDLLVMPMAWLLPRTESPFDQARQGPSLSTINYWALRCAPLFEPLDEALSPNCAEPQKQKPFFFVAANRMGTEERSTFAGSSCILRMRRGEKPLLLAALGAAEEGLLQAELETTEP